MAATGLSKTSMKPYQGQHRHGVTIYWRRGNPQFIEWAYHYGRCIACGQAGFLEALAIFHDA